VGLRLGRLEVHVFSHWAYILVGENNTGKTSFQRYLVSHLCGKRYDRLPRNIVKHIQHPGALKAFATIFSCNRSFQEKRSEYRSIAYYFKHFFKDADVCVLSSHTHGKSAEEIAEMIQMLKRRCYNVAGVFWSNSFDDEAREITLLPWNEILWIENLTIRGSSEISAQLDTIAKHFSELLIARANVQ
jgi:hypothetical protein